MVPETELTHLQQRSNHTISNHPQKTSAMLATSRHILQHCLLHKSSRYGNGTFRIGRLDSTQSQGQLSSADPEAAWQANAVALRGLFCRVQEKREDEPEPEGCR